MIIVAMLDLDSCFISINPSVRRILGYSPSEIIGTPLSRYVPKDQLAIHKQILERELSGAESRTGYYEMQAFRRDGRQPPTLEMSSKVIFGKGEKPEAIHAIARDISERKEVEVRQKLLVFHA